MSFEIGDRGESFELEEGTLGRRGIHDLVSPIEPTENREERFGGYGRM